MHKISEEHPKLILVGDSIGFRLGRISVFGAPAPLGTCLAHASRSESFSQEPEDFAMPKPLRLVQSGEKNKSEIKITSPGLGSESRQRLREILWPFAVQLGRGCVEFHDVRRCAGCKADLASR